MRLDNLTKIYAGLSNEELAVLAFKFMTDMNELEIARIMAAVPRKTYECQDLEFRHRLDGLFHMSAAFAIEHWRAYSGSLLALHAIHLSDENPDKIRQLLEKHEFFVSRLLALDCALLAVCEEHGVDPEAVRRLAEIDACSPFDTNLKPEAEYQAEMELNLGRLLGG